MNEIDKILENKYRNQYVHNVHKYNDSMRENELYFLMEYINNVKDNIDTSIDQLKVQKEIYDIMDSYNARNNNIWLDHIEIYLRENAFDMSLESIDKWFMWCDITFNEDYWKNKHWQEILALLDKKDELIDLSLPLYVLLQSPRKKKELKYVLELNFKNTKKNYRNIEKLHKYTGFLIPLQESKRNSKVVFKKTWIDPDK